MKLTVDFGYITFIIDENFNSVVMISDRGHTVSSCTIDQFFKALDAEAERRKQPEWIALQRRKASVMKHHVKRNNGHS